ncbi:hypothetical protein Glove_114g200 [Diversispora epigaea]|uniref:Cyclin N-terminal domain-containing protein n=1 Tax=Diversispora epigaea TaxID=1348612 RepID=A0A397JAX8_9GLOM|nr:hypothetical protein Glove_114g200 [Diversispora epigaea]
MNNIRDKINNVILFCLNDHNIHIKTYIPLSEFITEILRHIKATYNLAIGVLVLLVCTKREIEKRTLDATICNNRFRLFLASVMVTHYMLFDRSYSYELLSFITKLPKEEIKRRFDVFIKFIDYNLNIKYEEFIKLRCWSEDGEVLAAMREKPINRQCRIQYLDIQEWLD